MSGRGVSLNNVSHVAFSVGGPRRKPTLIRDQVPKCAFRGVTTIRNQIPNLLEVYVWGVWGSQRGSYLHWLLEQQLVG